MAPDHSIIKKLPNTHIPCAYRYCYLHTLNIRGVSGKYFSYCFTKTYAAGFHWKKVIQSYE